MNCNFLVGMIVIGQLKKIFSKTICPNELSHIWKVLHKVSKNKMTGKQHSLKFKFCIVMYSTVMFVLLHSSRTDITSGAWNC